MLPDFAGEFLCHALREIAHQIAVEMRIVRHVAGDDVGEQHDLGIGEQHAEFGPGQRLATRLALGKGSRRGQRLDDTVEQAARFQCRHEASLMRDVGQPALARQRKRQRLLVVVGEYQRADLVCHLGEQLVARRTGQRAFAHGRCQRDLDVDLDVRAVDAARIVDGVGVAAAAIHAEFDARPLCDAEIGALADDLGAHIERGDADGVVGAVANVLVGFAGSPDISADAAEPQKVDRRLEDGIHDLDRRSRGLRQPDRRGGGLRQGDRLLAARDDDAAFRQLRLVVILPGRARQLEHALPLGHRGHHVGIGIDEDVAMVEGGDQPGGR